MSAIGAALAKGLAALGGPAPATAILVGGLVVGAIGGGIAAANAGGGQGVTSTGKLAVYACPATGSPLLTIPGGQRLLATGRTEDATWLRIHYPDPGRSEAWVEAGPLTTTGSIADLPVAACAPEPIVLVPSFQPFLGLTAVQDNPPTEPPSGEPVPTPTPTATSIIARNERPGLSALTSSERRISYDTGDYCPNAATSAAFRVRATDDQGVQSVALFWRKPGSGAFARAPMTRTSGGERNGTWQATLDTQRNGITQAGSLAYYAVATDTDGATRRLPGNGSSAIQVERCENEGPDISSVRSLSGNRLWWDPQGAGTCQTATDITAIIKDVDGVVGATLFFRRPGSSSFDSKPMNNQTIKGRWYANLDTLGDKIGKGTLRWYIRATDREGLASRIDTRDITVRECDGAPPVIGGFNVSNTDISYPPCGPQNTTVSFDVTDALSGVDSVRMRVVNAQTGALVGTQTASRSGGLWRTAWSSNGLPLGTFRVEVRAVDNAGNDTDWNGTRAFFRTQPCIT